MPHPDKYAVTPTSLSEAQPSAAPTNDQAMPARKRKAPAPASSSSEVQDHLVSQQAFEAYLETDAARPVPEHPAGTMDEKPFRCAITHFLTPHPDMPGARVPVSFPAQPTCPVHAYRCRLPSPPPMHPPTLPPSPPPRTPPPSLLRAELE